ncbi:hypothetical protein F7725_021433 [Dissostichus mawsoni]|uniref:Uncharacterized protein n=1 Tax=Dissostichus mawsoni TaxID=36200 RepID=A0A7J5ZB74_DISMA|nr:hypothetical protein F7725_021433 [Dissostichus mawsoni]
MSHLNHLNLQLQGKNHTVAEMYEAVEAFRSKLHLLERDIHGRKLHFPRLREHCKKNEMPEDPVMKDFVSKLAENFKERFESSPKISRDILLFLRQPFSVSADGQWTGEAKRLVPSIEEGALQMEVLEMGSSELLKAQHKDAPGTSTSLARAAASKKNESLVSMDEECQVIEPPTTGIGQSSETLIQHINWPQPNSSSDEDEPYPVPLEKVSVVTGFLRQFIEEGWTRLNPDQEENPDTQQPPQDPPNQLPDESFILNLVPCDPSPSPITSNHRKQQIHHHTRLQHPPTIHQAPCPHPHHTRPAPTHHHTRLLPPPPSHQAPCPHPPPTRLPAPPTITPGSLPPPTITPGSLPHPPSHQAPCPHPPPNRLPAPTHHQTRPIHNIKLFV